jgi:4-amino-4-deoxy-L-arabinose transferase-like glycosyltransferase
LRGFGGGGFGGAGGAITFAGSQIPTLNAGLLRYLQAHRRGARFLVATTTTTYASLFILDTGQPVMTLGGYQGWDKILTVSQLKRLVANGTIHYFLLSGSGGSGPGNLSTRVRASGTSGVPGRFGGFGNASLPRGDANLNSVNNDLTHWIESTCSVVPSSKYQTGSIRSSTSQAQFGGSGGGGFGTESPGTLYNCTIT